MNKVFVTDIDGCVLDWDYGFRTWMEFQGHTVKISDKWNMAKCFDLPEDTIMQLIKQFNTSAAIGFLPPFRDAQYYIKLLHERYRWQFVAVTALSSDPHAQKLRIKNLNKIFGDNVFIDHYFVDTFQSKKAHLQTVIDKYGEDLYWLEDKKMNADLGSELGYAGMLMEHGHNLDYSGLCYKVKNWQEIYESIESECYP